MAQTEQFIQLVKHPVKFRLFLFSKLPSAFFSGVRVKSISKETTEVTVPYKWFSQNPFKSTYFACLAMAGELSSGLFALMYTYKNIPAVSMLVVGLEAKYYKKAVGLTTFSCEDGKAIEEAITATLKTGEGYTVRTTSTGKSNDGDLIAEFFITWSFKAKKNNSRY